MNMICRQILLNGSRLGMYRTTSPYWLLLIKYIGFYEPFRIGLNTLFGKTASEQLPATSLVAGAASGAIGGQHIQSKQVDSLYSM